MLKSSDREVYKRDFKKKKKAERLTNVIKLVNLVGNASSITTTEVPMMGLLSRSSGLPCEPEIPQK